MPHFGAAEEIGHVSSLSEMDNKCLPPTMAAVSKSEVGQASPFPFVTKTELTVTKEQQIKNNEVTSKS